MKRKKFGLIAALTSLLIAASILVTGCPQSNTSQGKPSNPDQVEKPVPPGKETPAVNTDEVLLEGFLGKISLDKNVITAASETITISGLPLTEAEASVTSSNAEIAEYEAPNKIKVKALPAETVEVKINITLKKNGTSKSREFTVKVFKNGESPAPEDFLKVLTLPEKVDEDFILPKTLEDKKTNITWSSENEKIIKVEDAGSDKKAVIERDIVGRKTVLKAEADAKSKSFEVTVLPYTEIKHGQNQESVYEFTAQGITEKRFENNTLKYGTVYTYEDGSPDTEKKEFTVKVSSLFLASSNKWLSVEEYYKTGAEDSINYLKPMLEAIERLLKQPQVSLKDLNNAFYLGGQNDEEIFKHVQNLLNPGISFEEFNKLDDSKKSETLKEALMGTKKEFTLKLGLPENAAVSEILAKIREVLQDKTEQSMKRDKLPVTYIYKIEKDPSTGSGNTIRFSTTAKYDSSKAWYENEGKWVNTETQPSGDYIKQINAYKTSKGIIDGLMDVSKKQGAEYSSKIYYGTFTESGNTFIFNGTAKDNPKEQITSFITDKKDGTLTIETAAAPKINSTLKFNGSTLK